MKAVLLSFVLSVLATPAWSITDQELQVLTARVARLEAQLAALTEAVNQNTDTTAAMRDQINANAVTYNEFVIKVWKQFDWQKGMNEAIVHDLSSAGATPLMSPGFSCTTIPLGNGFSTTNCQ